MPKINQLSPHVADLIAAGEVVERPSSVVKELVENAIDAGARHITVEIQNGGMTFIRITDDGCGMEPEDAERAFLRHATSKIRDQHDLEAIGTLGFRGEALAAISAVSRVDLMTKTAGAPCGTALRLEAGRVVSREETGCPDGTTMIVRDLFYNTPARMKFMKRDSAEGAAVFACVQKQAVAHPELAVRFLRDGKQELATSGDGQLLSAIYSVFGRKAALDMLEVRSQWEQTRIRGYITRPTASYGNRTHQVFFVNGRYVKSNLLSSALEEAYKNQQMVGRFPACVLELELPLQAVDVNVHPAKTEVKFLSERDVFDCVYYGALSTLNRDPGRVEAKLTAGAQPAAAKPRQDFFQTMDAKDYRAFAAAVEQAPKAAPNPRAVEAIARAGERAAVHTDVRVPSVSAPRPAAPEAAPKPQPAPVPQSAPIPQPVLKPQPAAPAAPAPAPEPPKGPSVPEPPEQTALPLPEQPDWRIVGEVLDTYFIVEQGEDVIFIDKHAAHERVLFEKLKAETHPIMAQSLLEPVVCGLSREEAQAVLDNRPLLARCGYEAEDFGGGAVVLRQIPADLDPAQAESELAELAGFLLEGHRTDPDALRDELLHSIACKAAIKAGYHTEPAERAALVRAVLTRDDIKYCPHGRPVCIRLTKRQLEHQFKRA